MTQRQGTSRWQAPRAHEPVHGTVEVPGSKSVTNRALVLAALASGQSTLVSPLRSRDTVLMIDALRALGTGIDDSTGEAWRVVPAQVRGQATVDCGLSGTVMRFVPPLAALGTGRVDFDGDPEARSRPMRTVLDALRTLGVNVTGTSLPFHLDGSGAVRGGTVTIDASASSQFVSGLLLSGACYDDGLTVCHDGGSVPSMPHITMTLDMLASAGVSVTSTGDDRRWRVEPGPVGGREWVIDPDLSNATPFLAAAAVTGGTVTVPGWPERTTQAGDAIRSILAAMGADVTLTGGALTVCGPERLTGIDVDLRAAGELAPTVAALATLAAGPSHLRGIAHLRGHETDRLAALVAEITGLGGDAEETAGGIDIRPARLHGGTWHAYADHRMATAGAIIGLVVDGVAVDDIACTGKTLPGFTEKWRAMLAGMPAEA